ncbi:hypothetical protein LTR62_006204 [Meristemomyces frigidus]|uniref:Calcipressin n=1 Tax=Meristemomyces frigidus TaxID=1508187 RepID=A0AAN7YES9_9PEZI|nr:hypothetical protein LTR62_006204 [Meristemomyces frigidus]
MSIDLSDLPPLTTPSLPSNTLLITNLTDPSIFQPQNLQSIQTAINDHAPIHTFSPLRSMRRVICTFYTIEDAIAIRQILDGEEVLGARVRVYFGQNIRIDRAEEERFLKAPKSSKLFFISPPPSPPMGWEMKDEEPPNKEVHAEDLAAALSKLHARPEADAALRDGAETQSQPQAKPSSGNGWGTAPVPFATRARSGTGTIVYDPQDHGDSPHLPAIAVEDTSASESPAEASPVQAVEERPAMMHTSRPPVELME